jgi:hypothetical protein
MTMTRAEIVIPFWIFILKVPAPPTGAALLEFVHIRQP